jgi:alpha-D-ribose 1-methylphosphonate 5-phosphate C-P lyase
MNNFQRLVRWWKRKNQVVVQELPPPAPIRTLAPRKRKPTRTKRKTAK